MHAKFLSGTSDMNNEVDVADAVVAILIATQPSEIAFMRISALGISGSDSNARKQASRHVGHRIYKPTRTLA